MERRYILIFLQPIKRPEGDDWLVVKKINVNRHFV